MVFMKRLKVGFRSSGNSARDCDVASVDIKGELVTQVFAVKIKMSTGSGSGISIRGPVGKMRIRH